jgi:glutaredoxin 3
MSDRENETARTRPSRVIAHGGVTVYTTEPCGFCRQAKALLQSRGVEYTEVNLAKDPGGRADLVALTGQMTFPQVVVGRRSIGGFRELLEADREGGLTDLLDRAA